MLKRIHVNMHRIRSNLARQAAERDPVLTVKTSKSNEYAFEVDILDAQGQVAATVAYRPEHPLSCGARVWIESRNPVRLKGQNGEPWICIE